MTSTRFVSFGLFEVDLDAGELRKRGRLIHVQQQPFEVLRLLLHQANDIVTRDQLRERLWPAGVTVDFDQSLNKSVTRLRAALGDAADNPRFIETLPKRGYRFIAPVSAGRQPVSALDAGFGPAVRTTPPESGQAKPAAVPFLEPTQVHETRLWSASVLVPIAIMASLIALLLSVTGPVR